MRARSGLATQTKENAPAKSAALTSITKQQTPIRKKSRTTSLNMSRKKNNDALKTRRQKQVQLTITTVIQFAVDFYPKTTIIKLNLRNDQLQYDSMWKRSQFRIFFFSKLEHFQIVFDANITLRFIFEIDKINNLKKKTFLSAQCFVYCDRVIFFFISFAMLGRSVKKII